MIQENQAEYIRSGLANYIGLKTNNKRIPCIVFLDDPSMPDNFLIDDPNDPTDDYLMKVEVPLSKHNDTRQMHKKLMCRVAYYVLKDILGDYDFRIVALNWFGDKENSTKWILEHRDEIDVINCSFTAPTADCIDEIKNLGIPITAAVGNNGNENGVSFPAYLPETIGVAAYELHWEDMADYSNKGEQVLCTAFTDIYVYADEAMTKLIKSNGTSTASPMVAIGILVYNFFHNVMLSQNEAKQLVINNCIDMYEVGHDTTSGYGMFVLPDYTEVNDMTIKLKIDSNEIEIDGVVKQMDTAPFIKDNRTFVPIRFVAEELGYNVEWDNDKREIIITK